MRQRDYLFSSDALRDAKQQIAKQFVDHWNWIDDAFHVPLMQAEDPMPLIRLRHRAIRDAYSLIPASETETIASRWRSAKMRELTGNTQKALRWKCAALNFNPESQNIDIALSGMTPWHDGERWVLAVALPSPEPLAYQPDYAPDDIVLIDPKTGAASLHNDTNPALVLPQEIDAFTVHRDAMQWARSFAASRVEWLHRKYEAKRIANITPTWLGLPDTALLIGVLDKVRWPCGAIITAGAGIDARRLQNYLYGQARTSRVQQPQQLGRAA